MKLVGVLELSLRFQNFNKILFFEMFSFGLFHSNGKYFKFCLHVSVDLYVCTISRMKYIQPAPNIFPCSYISTVIVALDSVIRRCKLITSQTLVGRPYHAN